MEIIMKRIITDLHYTNKLDIAKNFLYDIKLKLKTIKDKIIVSV